MRRILLCSFRHASERADGRPVLWVPPLWVPPLREGLELCGCEVLEPRSVDLIEPFLRRNETAWLQRNRVLLAEKLLAEARALHRQKPLDLILTYFWGFQIDPSGMRAITDLGIPTVNFFCDNVRDFESVEPLLKSFALHWVPEAGALERYRRAGAPHLHLPMAATPTLFDWQERTQREEVVFVGSADVLRGDLLLQVRDRLPLRVGGQGWKRSGGRPDAKDSGPRTSFLKRIGPHAQRLLRHGPAGEWRYFQQRALARKVDGAFSDLAVETQTLDEMLECFWRSAVTLGINRFPTPAAGLRSPRTYSRMRDVETPMAGAAYLTEWTEDLPHLFDLEREVLAYRDADDLVAQAERLLKDAELRKRLRQNGRQRCLASHTWKHRLEALFQHLGLHF